MMNRAALPIFWCVGPEAKGILAALVTGLSAIPEPKWVDWATGVPLKDYRPTQTIAHEFESAEALFKYMKRPPKHPVRVV